MRKPSLSTLDSPLLPLLIIALAVGIFVFVLLAKSNWHASSFVTAGDKFCDPNSVPRNLIVRRNSDGYDGQFYYRLGLDPFTSQRTDYGITLDMPSLRHQRILYPLLSSVLSLGHEPLVPVAMLLINVSALCLLGWLGGMYAQSLNQHSLWGILVPLYPGSLLTLTRDLVELSEINLLFVSLFLLRREKHATATLVLVLAVLAKETALIVAAAAALVYVGDRLLKQKPRVKWYYFAAPLATFCLWQLILAFIWGNSPVLAGRTLLGIPFKGFIASLWYAFTYQTPLQRRALPELLFLIAFAGSVVWCLRSTLASPPEVISWCLYGLLVVSLGGAIWSEDWAFLRAATEFSVIGTIILISSKSKNRIPMATCSLIFWLFLFIRLVRHGD